MHTLKISVSISNSILYLISSCPQYFGSCSSTRCHTDSSQLMKANWFPDSLFQWYQE